MSDRNCPQCGAKMEFHDRDCTSILGRKASKPHWFCSSCDIEVIGLKWRPGPPNPYMRNYMTEKEYAEYVKACNTLHDLPSEKPASSDDRVDALVNSLK